ncbi:MAG: hypothetical protein Q4A72_06635 [Bacillota bacterium]|nr:hypothetical protein [Bacillota bacterium]
MIILILLANIIAIIVLTIKYIRLNAKLLSREEFQEEAVKRAKELEYLDPVISCDACGTKFDTAKYKYCPSCGSGFSLDEEWLSRHDPDLDWAAENADDYAEAKIDSAIAHTAKIAKTLKITIIALVASSILLIAIASIGHWISNRPEYLENEVANPREHDAYKKQDYTVTGGGILVDKDGFRAAITGFYVEDDRYPKDILGEEYLPVKVEFKIENHSGRDQRLRFSFKGLNGIAKDGGFNFFYGLIKDGATLTVYDEIWQVRGGQIKEMVIGDIKVSSYEDGAVFSEREGNLKMTTNASYEYPALKISGAPNFENESIAVYYLPYDPTKEDKALLVVNKTDFDFIIMKNREKTGDAEKDGRIYKSALPARHTFMLTHSLTYDFGEAGAEQGERKASLSLTCPSDPSKDFSTPYFSIEQ